MSGDGVNHYAGERIKICEGSLRLNRLVLLDGRIAGPDYAGENPMSVNGGSGAAEVEQHGSALIGNEYILRADIPVQQVLTMQIFQSIQQLEEELSSIPAASASGVAASIPGSFGRGRTP